MIPALMVTINVTYVHPRSLTIHPLNGHPYSFSKIFNIILYIKSYKNLTLGIKAMRIFLTEKNILSTDQYLT